MEKFPHETIEQRHRTRSQVVGGGDNGVDPRNEAVYFKIINSSGARASCPRFAVACCQDPAGVQREVARAATFCMAIVDGGAAEANLKKKIPEQNQEDKA